MVGEQRTRLADRYFSLRAGIRRDSPSILHQVEASRSTRYYPYPSIFVLLLIDLVECHFFLAMYYELSCIVKKEMFSHWRMELLVCKRCLSSILYRIFQEHCFASLGAFISSIWLRELQELEDWIDNILFYLNR